MQKHFSTQKMFMTIPKYHGGTMSHCTILDLCHIKESKRRLSAPAHNDDMESDVE